MISLEWNINLRILFVTQGRQCFSFCFCGIYSCIDFQRLVLKIVHCVFTGCFSSSALHVIEVGGQF